MHLETSDSGLGSRGRTATTIELTLGSDIAGDLANVSVNDDFWFVIRLLDLGWIRWRIGFWFPCHAFLHQVRTMRLYVDPVAENGRANDLVQTAGDWPKARREFLLPPAVAEDAG